MFTGEATHREQIAVPNPLVGAEMAVTPNRSGAWRLLNLVFTFTASAVVAVRQVQLRLGDGSRTYWFGVTATTQAATVAATYQATPQAVPAAAVGGIVQLALPPEGLWIPRGWTLSTVTTLIDVGDQYSGIALLVEEFPDGPDFVASPTLPTLYTPAND